MITGARRTPASQAATSASGGVAASQNRLTSSGVSSSRNAQPWLKPGARRVEGVGEDPLDDGRVDRLVGVVAHHPPTVDDLLELHVG